MHLMPALVAALTITLALAGCLSDDGAGTEPTILTERGARLSYAPGSLSSLEAGPDGLSVDLPAGTIYPRDGRLVLDDGPQSVAAGETFTFIAAPGPSAQQATVESRAVDLSDLATQDAAPFLTGDNIVAGLRFHEQYEGRIPGTPTWVESQDWAVEQFASWGYEVEHDPFGTNDLPQTVCVPEPFVAGGQSACPASFSNIVATKQAADPLAPIIVIGGHYDTVPDTIHGAWDNTGGSLTTMEIARALAPYDFDVTLKFALWGGEENGLLGASFWLLTNEHLRPLLTTYINLDAIGMTWPAPLPAPRPMTLLVAPDVPCQTASLPCDGVGLSPIAASLRDENARILADWAGYPEEAYRFEGAIGGVHTSDEIPFEAELIPSIAYSTRGPLMLRAHTPIDTTDVMAAESLYAEEFDPENVVWPDQATLATAEAALADSFEPYLWGVTYYILSVNQGFYAPPLTIAAVPGASAAAPA